MVRRKLEDEVGRRRWGGVEGEEKKGRSRREGESVGK